MFDGFLTKMAPKANVGILPFSICFVTCFRTLLPFTTVRPTSARNHVFQLFFQKIKRMYPHLYRLPGEDRQVRRDRFYHFNEKLMSET